MQHKYINVKNTLKEAIISGEYPINMRLPTENQFMAKFDVSRYTIRKAVGELEREHFIYRIQGGGMFVQDWHKDWEPNINSNMIGIITTHIAGYIFPEIISGIDHALSQSNYAMLLSNTHNTYEREHKNLISMLDIKVAGLIVEPTRSALKNPNLDLYQQFEANKIPLIFINAAYPDFRAPSITTDDIEGEKALMNHLFNLGHESILGVFQVDDIQGTRRMHGFVESYQEHENISYKSNIIMYQSNDDLTAVINKILSFVQQKDGPTAITCYNDQLAIQVINVLQVNGLQIPKDVSVVGFDDYQFSQFFRPSLTTVTHEKSNMGLAAGQMMLDILNKKPVHSIVYEPKLVIRDSSTAIKVPHKA